MFAWGANSHGQLGTGDKLDRDEPCLVCVDSEVDLITGGGGHSLYAAGHQLFTCGLNTMNQLGRDDLETMIFRPALNKFDSPIRAVACGWDFSLILTDDGSLFGLGSNADNQLGVDNLKATSIPIPISLPPVKCISAGLKHALAITNCGSIFTWGSNRRGQLGLTDRNTHGASITEFSEHFSNEEKPVDCACGAYHSAVLSDRGSIIIWGDLKYFTSPERNKCKTSTIRLDRSHFNDHVVVEITSGWNHMVALTESGAVFTWGRSNLHQLGRSHTIADPSYDPVPAQVLFPERITKIATGSEHSLAVDASGRLWAWGWNEHGMCGVVGQETYSTPQIVHIPSQSGNMAFVKRMGAGYGHSFAVIE